MAVQPVCAASLQNPPLCAPGVPRDRAHRELALNDGTEGDHRRCGARQCQHLAYGTVPRAARLGQPGPRQRRRLAIATAVLPRAARDVERAGAVPRVQVPGVGCWPEAHAVHKVVGNAAHLLARQATRPHDHLGNRKVRLLVAVYTSVDEQRHTTSAARSGANVDSIDQLQLRSCIGSAHDHPVRVRADVVLDRRLPASVVRHPCTATPMAVQPVCAASVQNPLLRTPGCQHLACGTVPHAARLGQPGPRQRRRHAIATAVLPRAARDVERAGAVPRVQVPGVGCWRRANAVHEAADRAQVRPATTSGGGIPVPIVAATVAQSGGRCFAVCRTRDVCVVSRAIRVAKAGLRIRWRRRGTHLDSRAGLSGAVVQRQASAGRGQGEFEKARGAVRATRGGRTHIAAKRPLSRPVRIVVHQ
eukprot:scaffold10332_cov69-Phaeocystis_antarctica.AAC.1